MDQEKKDILSEIILNKKSEVAKLSPRKVEEFKRRIDQMPETKDFIGAISASDKISVIAEIKKSSPSMGPVREDANVSEVAKLYERCGAAAISVLTDKTYFSGSVEDLIEARKSVRIPLLRKDFIINQNQILEARACGADAILLIVAALDDIELRDFFQMASELGLASLVETHSAEEIDRALALKPSVIGINNRCLKTLAVDLATSEKLRSLIPDDICVISESGIKDRSDISRLLRAGVDGFLVGTSIMKAENPENALRELTGR